MRRWMFNAIANELFSLSPSLCAMRAQARTRVAYVCVFICTARAERERERSEKYFSTLGKARRAVLCELGCITALKQLSVIVVSFAK